MRYNLRDRSKPGQPVIGAIELVKGKMPSDVIFLAQRGQLYIQPQMSTEKKKALEAYEDEKAELAEAKQSAIDEEDTEARQAPEGAQLNTLKPRQLKEICRQRGLKTYGNRGDLIARIEADNAARSDEDEVASTESNEDLFDPTTKTVAELREIAKNYGISTSGTKDELIERIIAAAEAEEDDAEADETEGSEPGGEEPQE